MACSCCITSIVHAENFRLFLDAHGMSLSEPSSPTRGSSREVAGLTDFTERIA